MSALDLYAQYRNRFQLAYDSGRLVPFLGSGVSFPACRLWKEFVQELEVKAGYAPSRPISDKPTPAEMVRWANKAMQHLRLTRTPEELIAAVRDALVQGTEIPPATAALAQGFWPLVLTTNYDDLFWTAFANAQSTFMKIMGRSPSDCHAVLSSLRAPSEPILWAVQGFLGQVCAAPLPWNMVDPLSREIVVGHEEYRHVTFNATHFRRAFAEVFRNRSFLFLGFGLQDPYIMDLFGEIIELFGPNPIPHYAFAKRDEVDAAFFAQRFNIIVITYDDHRELSGLINQLCVDLDAPRPKSSSWACTMSVGKRLYLNDRTEALNVMAGPLPTPSVHECVAISVGHKDNQIWFGEQSSAMANLVEHRVIPQDWQTSKRIQRSPMVFQLGDHPVYLVAARDTTGERDLRRVSAAVEELLDVASQYHHVVHTGILAAGPRRSVPATFLFTEMLRGYSKWHSRSHSRKLEVFIHVVAPDVLLCLRSGRIDISELLLCKDLRFWLELEDNQNSVERLPYHCAADTKVLTLVLEACRLTCNTWTVEVTPAPKIGSRPLCAAEIPPDTTLEDIGVVPGSTLRFSFGKAAGVRSIGTLPVDRRSDHRIAVNAETSK